MFPAPAGINGESQPQESTAKSVPRASGNKRAIELAATNSGECSPRQRE
ncbi:hypothetical protein M2734_003048 [Salmonella enterica]|nr:hypothetical protein [Salmonella enterica]